MKERLAHTLYDEYLIVLEMIDRLGKAPFIEVYGNAERQSALLDKKALMESQFGRRATRDRILSTYERARARNPDDWVLQRNHADALRLYGRFAEAAALYHQVLEIFPNHPDALSGLATCREQLARKQSE